jgi:hypothetical protein
MAQCIVDGCKTEVTKEGFKLCHPHWTLDKAGKLSHCESCGKPKDHEKSLCSECWKSNQGRAPSKGLTATAVGSKFGLKADRINKIFAELGWIEHGPADKGWKTTEQGRKQKAVDQTHSPSGVPFVTWPEEILNNRIFAAVLREFKGEAPEAEDIVAETSKETDFRDKFPAQYLTSDGHRVRSRGEVMIDNWLYTSQVVHAYERKVPIEESLYCDFWLPAGKVYIEFWGMEEDKAYAARKNLKIELYKKHGLHLIELRDADIMKLDDVLPAKLLPYGISIT